MLTDAGTSLLALIAALTIVAVLRLSVADRKQPAATCALCPRDKAHAQEVCQACAPRVSECEQITAQMEVHDAGD